MTKNLPAINDLAKCEGIGCAFKASCGRFLRLEGSQQVWASYYAMADDDCQHFEATAWNGKQDEHA